VVLTKIVQQILLIYLDHHLFLKLFKNLNF
jgi:hypothetical protein